MEDIREMYPHQLRFYKKELLRWAELCDVEEAKWLTSRCDICDEHDIAKEDIPKDWGWVVGYSALICDVCIERWNERFGNCEVTRGEL